MARIRAAHITLLCLALLCCAPLGSDAAQNLLSAQDPQIQYVGRHLFNNDSTVSFDWSGVQAVIGFEGTIFGIVMHDPGNNWLVFIDGANYTFQSSPSTSIYKITTTLPQGDHTATLLRASEADLGVTVLVGFLVSAGTTALPLPPRPTRRIEWIGDSITCAYGIEGTPPCNYTFEQQNEWLAYGPLSSRALGADFMITCQSGIGLVRNYGSPNTTSPNPLPTFWNHTLETVQNVYWDFKSWPVQAVVINLGTNDYSSDPTPPDAMWIAAYNAFLNVIYSKYGRSVQIFLVCGPMISGEVCNNVQTVASQNKLPFINLQNILMPQDIGCNGHPNVQGHAIMSSLTVPVLQKYLGW